MTDVFTTERRVEFCQTDTAGIAHFSTFLCFMEQAEHDLWRHIGASVVQPLDDGSHLSWPRVHVECDFSGTAQFEDVLQIAVHVVRLGTKSVTFGFRFSCRDQVIGEGKIVAVCCRFRTGEPLTSVAIPADLADGLRPFCQTPSQEG